MFLSLQSESSFPLENQASNHQGFRIASQWVSDRLFLFNRLECVPGHFQEIYIFNYVSVIFPGNLRKSPFNFFNFPVKVLTSAPSLNVL